ncbi:hypothetical protein CDL15_Pgr008234 [Punica granatum]|uniref:Amidase domain-containing protein n=1 Tax=Punica granatum TaxID=22663 RepID=A0A218VUJ4_PUNGR|nr:hypothetical protein CDL15_Pgr008234 [Punica granatum]
MSEFPKCNLAISLLPPKPNPSRLSLASSVSELTSPPKLVGFNGVVPCMHMERDGTQISAVAYFDQEEGTSARPKKKVVSACIALLVPLLCRKLLPFSSWSWKVFLLYAIRPSVVRSFASVTKRVTFWAYRVLLFTGSEFLLLRNGKEKGDGASRELGPVRCQFLKMTEVPESPMFRPEFPPQEPEPNVVLLDEDCKPEDRTDFALKCLPDYSPPSSLNREHSAFRYWKIRDYAYAYRSKLVTPATVAERIIAIIEELSQRNPPAPLLISFDAEDVRKQAAASTKRFEEVGTRWLHKVSSDNGDAACVSKLRSCGVVLLGKANMHEVRMGASGNNPNYGTARNPHDLDRYTGGSSSGSAAIVASGLCPAALGTDAGGSVRIPSSLCGVVGLKSTFGRTDIGGYAAILGASPADRICLQPSVPCLPNLQNSDIFGPVRLGKYTTWFNDVHSTDISDTCEDILSQLSKIHGCEVVEIVIPELLEMHTAHVVAMGTDMIHSLDPYWEDSGKGAKFTYDTRINIALLKSFSASDYVAAQCLRMTAPEIPPSALTSGETNLPVTGSLMRFTVAANFLGFPAITVPVGYDKQGLPIGLQFMGRPWGEASILRLAYAVEANFWEMGKKRVMLPAKDVDLSAVKYEPEVIQAPHLTGLVLKLFIKIIEAPVIGPAIISYLKKQNKMVETLRNTVIPEAPMFKPEFPPQDPEPGTFLLEEDGKPEERVETALKCLPEYNPADSLNSELTEFRYWKIRDFAYAYRSSLVTPSMVAERIIAVIEDFNNEKPPAPLLITFDAEEVRKQAVASTKRFEEGRPLSTLDGIFVAIKDDIGLYPFIAKGATTWMDEVRSTNADAVSVSRLRSCGVIFVGKANMHELGMGTTGNNPNYGTTRNPHALDRYTGGSSSGPAAIVASGLCSAALGTDGGGTVEIIGPIASSVEDVMLVYAAILGASPADRISLRPAPPCLPNLAASEIGSLRLGKYTGWFNDVHTTDISDKCEDILNQLTKTYGCEVVEIVIPELHEMRTAHLVSIGSETMASLNPDCEDGRRVMHHHMEIFKKVDFIVTPTTGMTAPKIPTSALKYGETDMQVTGYLMRFILAGNLLGLPAVSVPVGYDKQGLPIGLQLIGRPWGEASLLRLASAVEELSAGSKKRPASFYDVLKTN